MKTGLKHANQYTQNRHRRRGSRRPGARYPPWQSLRARHTSPHRWTKTGPTSGNPSCMKLRLVAWTSGTMRSVTWRRRTGITSHSASASSKGSTAKLRRLTWPQSCSAPHRTRGPDIFALGDCSACPCGDAAGGAPTGFAPVPAKQTLPKFSFSESGIMKF